MHRGALRRQLRSSTTAGGGADVHNRTRCRPDARSLFLDVRSCLVIPAVGCSRPRSGRGRRRRSARCSRRGPPLSWPSQRSACSSSARSTGGRSSRRLAFGVLLGAASSALHVRALEHGVVPVLASRHADVDVVARLVRDPVATTTSRGTPLVVTDATVTRVLGGGALAIGELTDPRAVLRRRMGRPAARAARRRVRPALASSSRRRRRGRTRCQGGADARRPATVVAASRRPGAARPAARDPGACRPTRAACFRASSTATPRRCRRQLQADMRVTGLTHLEAVSGENVSVLLAVVVAIAGGLGLRRRSRVLVCSLSLIGFVVLARPTPSVLRAAVMGGIVLLGILTGRRAAALPALSASVLSSSPSTRSSPGRSASRSPSSQRLRCSRWRRCGPGGCSGGCRPGWRR